MRWSFRFARVAGIDLKIHLTFFLIVVLGAMQWAWAGVGGMLFGAVLIGLLFVCVVLHELGHSLVAQRYGIPVREIILLPIGGVALLGRNPNQPLQELLIAIAGPLVNVAIAIVLAVVLMVAAQLNVLVIDPRLVLAERQPPSAGLMLLWLLNVNILLVVFNMIPAFPMDGGRIFRAIVGFFTDWTRATRISSVLGQIIAFGMGLLGFMGGNLWLVLIAAFVFFGASATYADERARVVLHTRRIGDAYNQHAITLSEYDRIDRVCEYMLTSYQPDFAVMRGRELLGVVSRPQVLQALAAGQRYAPVTQIMLTHYPRISAETRLDEVQQQMNEAASRIAAVYDGSNYLGLVSADDLAEALTVIASMDGEPGTQTPSDEAPLPSRLSPYEPPQVPPADGDGRRARPAIEHPGFGQT